MSDPARHGQPPKLVVIVGPTGVGKTDTSIALAEMIGGEVISADSRCLYCGLDIGTAKPTREQRARVPHHLIDVTDPATPWTLAQYQSAAYAAIESICARGRVPLLVGGTGQYVRAVADGWQIPPGANAPGLRVEFERQLMEQGLEVLAARLRDIDPASANTIDIRNPRRVIRALEVASATGESFVGLRRKQAPPYPVRWIGLTRPRPELYRRIDARVEAMFAAGLVAEVERLVRHGYSWETPALSALGYKQVGAYLRGECSLEAAAQAIKRATRQFVRRQANWFKPSDPAIRWFQAMPGVERSLVGYLGEN